MTLQGSHTVYYKCVVLELVDDLMPNICQTIIVF